MRLREVSYARDDAPEARFTQEENNGLLFRGSSCTSFERKRLCCGCLEEPDKETSLSLFEVYW